MDMELEEKQSFDTESLQTVIDSLAQVLGLAVGHPFAFGAGHTHFGEDADFFLRAFPGFYRLSGQLFAVVEIFMIEAVGIGGIEEANTGIEGKVDKGNSARLGGPPFGGEAKEAEGEGGGQVTEE